jgi:hypothetical protein
MAPLENIAISAGPAPEPEPLSYVVAALVLASCAMLAWRRRRPSPAQREHGRWERTAVGSLPFAAAMATLMMLPSSVGEGEPVALLVGVAMVGFLLSGLVAFVVIAMIELTLRRAHLSRSRRWLIAAPPIFAVAFTLLLAGVSLSFGQDLSEPLRWDMLQLPAITTGSALIWWSCLPARPSEVGRLFE